MNIVKIAYTQPQQETVNAKKVLAETFKRLGIIEHDNYSCELHIVINQGGIRHIKRTEVIE